MEDQPQTIPSLRRRVEELEGAHKNLQDECVVLDPQESEKLLKDCILELESAENFIESSEAGLFGSEDLDTCLKYLKEELDKAKGESIHVSQLIEVLAGNLDEESQVFKQNLEELKCSLAVMAQDTKIAAANEGNSNYGHGNENLEILELEDQIGEKKAALKSLQDLHSMVEWFDSVEKMEDLLTGLRVIGFEDNCIRLSLQTYIPKMLDQSSPDQARDVVELSEVNHELLIEVLEGTMKLKRVEIFPNDVHISDIVDAAKSQSKSSLRWFLTEVQNRIALYTLKQIMVKDANRSRHSFEYLERDDTIVAHMVGGIDAFIKVPPNWPILNHPLELISLKSSDHSKDMALSFLSKVLNAANSLDEGTLQKISSFLDAIDKILLERIGLDLQSCDASKTRQQFPNL